MRQAERIQAYLRATAHGFYEAVPVPPFTCFFHSRDALRFFNYAIPDEPAGGDLREALERLRAAFRERGRLPRFEYVEGFAPELGAALEGAGFELELRAPLMTVPTADVPEPELLPGFEIVPSTTDVRAYLTVGRRAFGNADEPEATDEEVEARLARGDVATALIGLLDAEPVAVSAATPPLDGLTEVAGVGVLEHARGRGIGGAMTAAAARDAATKGAELAFLSPGSEGAQSVYTRVGFRPAEVSLYYADPEDAR
jgi:ribosomal protein S18 acetylase RimI-like enzyme